jgi:hypothetical protein
MAKKHLCPIKAGDAYTNSHHMISADWLQLAHCLKELAVCLTEEECQTLSLKQLTNLNFGRAKLVVEALNHNGIIIVVHLGYGLPHLPYLRVTVIIGMK